MPRDRIDRRCAPGGGPGLPAGRSVLELAAPPSATARCGGWESLEAPARASGLVADPDGRVHRPAAQSCASTQAPHAPQPGGRAERARCDQDSECTLRSYGHCDAANQLGIGVCRYGCVTDADCGAGKLCVCGQLVGRCLTATCRTDAECGAGRLCARYFPQERDDEAFACTDPRDACARDCECQSNDGTPRICVYEQGVRRCIVGGRREY